jgi:pimeloyl-ACP methyl ester carboxylesterase
VSQVTQRRVEVAGVGSPVLQAGPSTATEAVVFVHGNPGPAEDWRGMLAWAGEFARAVAPDMPGFGGADKPRGFNYTIQGYAGHLSAVLVELGIERAHLVLHDFGGAWGLAWGLRRPERMASVTLINTGVLPGYRWHHWARIWRTPLLGELAQLTATRGATHAVLGRENPRLPPDAIDRIYEASRGWPTKRAVLKLYRATPAGAMRGPIESLAALDVPALVLWGTEDAYLPWTYAERQREAFPSARVELLEGLGHWPFIEEPAAVGELLMPFLRARLPSRVS